MPKYQFAYRHGHSTETALLKVYNDLQVAERGEVSFMCLLSAAFDTVDHKLLVKRLECKFGIVGEPLEWITS